MKLNQKKILYKNKDNHTFCDVLDKVIVTELSTRLMEINNIYVFQVKKWANKPLIQKAIESLFNVTVEKVNTKTQPGKGKFRAGKYLVTSSRKIAIIFLKKGDVIDVNRL